MVMVMVAIGWVATNVFAVAIVSGSMAAVIVTAGKNGQ
jgi:hypothetical protein